MDNSGKKIGLSLSGGGYRATAYHLGTLKKLQELNILQRVDIISTISGGSITGAYYSLEKDDFDAFESSLYKGLQEKDVIKKVFASWIFIRTILFALIFIAAAVYVLFTPYYWSCPLILILFVVLLLKFQFSIFPVSRVIERVYDSFFYNKATLGKLPDSPVLVVGSTNLQTGRPFSFSKLWMQDSTYQYLKNDVGIKEPVQFKPAEFPLARAVMASSCVPFAFTPIRIAKEFFANPDRDFKRVNPQLVDGGVFDNQGIHKIMQGGQYSCHYIITSDAGGKLSFKGNYNNLLSLLIRSMDIFMARIKNAQIVNDVYENTASANNEIAFQSLGWDIDRCIPGFIDNLAAGHVTKTVIAALDLKPEWVSDPNGNRTVIQAYLEQKTNYAAINKPTAEELRIARSVSTNLTALSKLQVDSLIKQAAALTELQVILYCPTLLKN